mgnify:CR=1 FL=1
MTRIKDIRKAASNRQKLTSLNLEKLKGLLSYFTYLQANGDISDKTFEALVRHACSIFLENEVEIVVQETLERKFLTFLHSKFAAPAEDIESAIYSLDVLRKTRSR